MFIKLEQILAISTLEEATQYHAGIQKRWSRVKIELQIN